MTKAATIDRPPRNAQHTALEHTAARARGQAQSLRLSFPPWSVGLKLAGEEVGPGAVHEQEVVEDRLAVQKACARSCRAGRPGWPVAPAVQFDGVATSLQLPLGAIALPDHAVGPSHGPAELTAG